MPYTLQPYAGTTTRYTCPACGRRRSLVRYIDTATGDHIADHVGRCNREVNCGYHCKPAQYFAAEGTLPVRTPNRRYIPRRPPSTLPISLMVESFTAYHSNNFVQFLVSRFGSLNASLLCDRYMIGTAKEWHGATIFWQADTHGRIRTGKIMLYDVATGRRIKEPYPHITWVHKVLQLPDYELQQCLYGQHRLDHVVSSKEGCRKPVAIVESEKTAIIASLYLPQYEWLACGSLTNLTADRCAILRNYDVVLFPDLNAYGKWSAKAKELRSITNMIVSDLLERHATEEDRANGLDLADYLLRFPLSDFVTPRCTIV